MKNQITKSIARIIEKCDNGATLFINENWTRAELYNDHTDEKSSVSISVCTQIQNHPIVKMEELHGFFSGMRGYRISK